MSIKFTLKLHFELISLGAAMCKTLLQQLCECMCVSSATVTVSPLGELLALQNTYFLQPEQCVCVWVCEYLLCKIQFVCLTPNYILVRLSELLNIACTTTFRKCVICEMVLK